MPSARSLRNASGVLPEGALSRDGINIVRGPKHLDDRINMREFHFEPHDLIATSLDLAVDTSALLNQRRNHMCLCHGFTLRNPGGKGEARVGAFAT